MRNFHHYGKYSYSGHGGSGGRGGRNDVPNPQVQANDPEVQEEVQNNQEEIPIVQEAVANEAVVKALVPVAPVQPNLLRNQVPVISNCKFKLHACINGC